MIADLRAQAPARGAVPDHAAGQRRRAAPRFHRRCAGPGAGAGRRGRRCPPSWIRAAGDMVARGRSRARQYLSEIVTPFATMVERPGPQGWERDIGAAARARCSSRGTRTSTSASPCRPAGPPLGLTVLHDRTCPTGAAASRTGAGGWPGAAALARRQDLSWAADTRPCCGISACPGLRKGRGGCAAFAAVMVQRRRAGPAGARAPMRGMTDAIRHRGPTPRGTGATMRRASRWGTGGCRSSICRRRGRSPCTRPAGAT